jgi:hypothetical protein
VNRHEQWEADQRHYANILGTPGSRNPTTLGLYIALVVCILLTLGLTWAASMMLLSPGRIVTECSAPSAEPRGMQPKTVLGEEV